MGLTQSISFPTSIFLSVLRTVFSLDLTPNSTTPVYINSSQLKRISSGKSPTRDASVETISLEVSRKLENNFQERYKWLVENRKARKNITFTDVVVPARSCVAVVQQTMTDDIGRKSRNIETESILPLDFSFSSPTNSENNSLKHNNNPWFVSQWYNSVNGNSYGITIDTKNSDIMLSLETFSKESSCGISEESESLAEMKFELENGKEISLKFNKWDPKTLEMLSKAMLESTGYAPTVKSRQDKKEIYSFVYIDRLGRNICCSLDINNTDVLKKLKMMEEWALQRADPCDLFDVKINSSTTFQLDLKNPTTIRNLKSLKEESITGVTKKLINPIKKKEKMMAKSLAGCAQTKTLVNKTEPVTVELFSPYTGTFTAIFDLYHHQTMITLQNFTKEFQKSLYEYDLKLNTDLDETFEIKLDMANPKVVYELVKMTRKYSIDVVNFNPKLILNNLITIYVPEDETYLTVDISKSLVYGGLFDLANRDKIGVQLTIPCAGILNNI
nr:uncharacterized protein LOC111421334 [Onthophagus taurus]